MLSTSIATENFSHAGKTCVERMEQYWLFMFISPRRCSGAANITSFCPCDGSHRWWCAQAACTPQESPLWSFGSRIENPEWPGDALRSHRLQLPMTQLNGSGGHSHALSITNLVLYDISICLIYRIYITIDRTEWIDLGVQVKLKTVLRGASLSWRWHGWSCEGPAWSWQIRSLETQFSPGHDAESQQNCHLPKKG